MQGLKRIFYLLHEDAWIVIHIFLWYYWKAEHPIVFLLLLCNRRDLFFIRVSKLLDRSSPKSMWFLWNIFSKGTHMLQCLCGKSLKKNKNPSGKSHCVFFPSVCADLQSNLCSKSVNAGKLSITWALVVRPITDITAEGFNIQLFFNYIPQVCSVKTGRTVLLGPYVCETGFWVHFRDAAASFSCSLAFVCSIYSYVIMCCAKTSSFVSFSSLGDH